MLSDRPDRYFESLGLEQFHSQELGLKFDANDVTVSDDPDAIVVDAMNRYVRLKGAGRGKVFARTAERNANYLIECIDEKCFQFCNGIAIEKQQTTPFDSVFVLTFVIEQK